MTHNLRSGSALVRPGGQFPVGVIVLRCVSQQCVGYIHQQKRVFPSLRPIDWHFHVDCNFGEGPWEGVVTSSMMVPPSTTAYAEKMSSLCSHRMEWE